MRCAVILKINSKFLHFWGFYKIKGKMYSVQNTCHLKKFVSDIP